MPIWEINKRDGAVLYRGEARTKKEFIQGLVDAGESLADADLAGANLSHLDLDDARFEHADLSGANLTGATCRDAVFAGADMRGVKAAGLQAERADFRGADLSRHPGTDVRSYLGGAVLTYSNLEGARLDHADLSDTGMSSTSMIGATARKTAFRNAALRNVDWSHSVVVGCDFDGADMTPNMQVAEQHLPNRTLDATIMANKMGSAKLGAGNGAFKTDRWLETGMSAVTWMGVTGAFVAAGLYLPMDADVDMFKQYMGTGLSFVAVATAAGLVKEKITDGLKEGIYRAAEWLNPRIRSLARGYFRHERAMASLAVAFVSSCHRDALIDALALTGGKSSFARAGSVLMGQVEVLVCNRRHLAFVLTRLSDSLNFRARPKKDFVMVRASGGDANVPKAIVHGTDGSVLALWVDGRGVRSATRWGADGTVSTTREDHRNAVPYESMRDTFRSFSSALLSEAGFHNVTHDEETHAVKMGRDGSVVITSKSNGRVDNPLGPALLTPDGRRMWFTNGRHLEERDEYPLGWQEPVRDIGVAAIP